MKKLGRLVFIVLLGLVSTFRGQQSTATITGHITADGEILPFTSIYISRIGKGTSANEVGFYELKVPVGTHRVQVSSQGYRLAVKQVTVSDKERITLDFELVKDPLGLDEVVISATRNRVERKNAPVVVSTIKPSLLNATQSLSVADGLNYAPG